MSVMPANSVRGHLNFALSLPKIQSSPRKLDTITQSFQSDREDTFLNSRAFPGYPLMEVEEVETKVEIPGLAYEHTLRGRGLLTPRAKCESTEKKQPDEGWDEIPETWLTHAPGDFIIGSAHPQHPNVYLNAIESIEKVTEKISRVQCSYKGIILDSGGNIKPEKWKGTVNGETISTASDILLDDADIFVDDEGNFNGWLVGARKTKFDISRVVLTCTKLSLTPPPTQRVGMQLTPGHIPVTVYSLFDEAWWSASGFTWNYPGKDWKLAGVQWDQVLTEAAFLYTLSFEYQPEKIPTF